MSLSDKEIDEVSNRFIKKLEASRTISDEKHRDHHHWIDYHIAKEKKREEMWYKIKVNVIGGLIIGAFTGIGVFLKFFGEPVVKFLAKKFGW